MITQERVRDVLYYNARSGQFRWSESRGSVKARDHAGWFDEDGYRLIRIDGVLYQAHRLAWLYINGEWPPSGFIDHVNGNPSDNRLANLRDASKRLNQENRRKANRNNKAKLLGVSPNGKRFAATINTPGKHHYLGTFDSPQEAHTAYVNAKRRLHNGCTL